jgi:hypothetical protein
MESRYYPYSAVERAMKFFKGVWGDLPLAWAGSSFRQSGFSSPVSPTSALSIV